MKNSTLVPGILAILVVGLVLVGGGVANAVTIVQTVNVDFNYNGNTFSGVGAAPDSGTFWNGVQPGPAEAFTSFASGTLKKSTNINTSPAITVTIGNGTKAAQTGNALFGDFIYDSSSGAAINVSPGTFTISGLNNSSTYQLYVYSQSGAANERTKFVIGAQTVTVINDFTNHSNYLLGVNYGLFASLQPVGGAISGTFGTALAGNFSAFNGFQLLEVVPEPSAFALLFTAGLGLLAIGRRSAMKTRQVVMASCVR